MTDSTNVSCRPHFPKRAVITGGMPYGNKNLHFGHIAGVFVPADFFARFLRDRLGKENVLFVSGTDCYGSPIAEGYRKKVEQETYKGTILDYVTSNHTLQKRALDAYGISLDFYGGSALEPSLPIHEEMADAIMHRLYEKGTLTKRSTKQFYDTKAHTFLNGRQVIGRCPIKGCKSDKAYAEECELGHQFDPEELISPVSQLTGTKPELRPAPSWYFDLSKYQQFLRDLTDRWEEDPQVRNVVTSTIRETLVAPMMYIQEKFREAFDAVCDRLPAYKLIEAEKSGQSFTLVFKNWEDRDCARDILDAEGIRFRTGKTLLPYRMTGNISWGLKAPDLDDLKDLTIWVWTESLWAPITFTRARLDADATSGEHRYASDDWHDWWCSDDAQVYQFIGQDNIFFYCVVQNPLWDALDWGLTTDIPVANYHILFMNKKASSSGSIKPPMAEELLDFYTPEQLRAHWLSLGLDQRAVSFSPKAFDTSVSRPGKDGAPDLLTKDDPRVVDPALKESAFLTNIFNRLARSCFYGAANACSGHLPTVDPHQDVIDACINTTLAFERMAHDFDAHGALGAVEEFARAENKRWDEASKAAKGNDAAYEQALADAFCVLRTVTLLMHPAVPAGCERIAQAMNFSPEVFFSWEHAMEGPKQLARILGEDAQTHMIEELPPRFDFFKAHPSQQKKKQ